MGHPHQGLPATPQEIRQVLIGIESIARVLDGESNIPPCDPGLSAMLHGLVLGLEGGRVSPPAPEGYEGDLGFRVGQSLIRGGSPWV